MSRHIAVLLVFLLSAFGCARTAGPTSAAPGTAPKGEASAGANRYLAYEHTVAIATDDDNIAPLFEAAQAACRGAVAESCAILEARLAKGDYSFASLKFRASAKGIRDLIAVLSAQGEIANRSTTAEDLAGPIEDNTKKLAMLSDYRGKLEELRGRTNADLDALIKLTRELAQVQSEIESLTGSQAQLVQRVETEVLNVSIGSSHSGSFWNPIADSASEFGENLSQAIAVVITALAFLLPWILIALLVTWIWRKWRSRRKPIAG